MVRAVLIFPSVERSAGAIMSALERLSLRPPCVTELNPSKLAEFPETVLVDADLSFTAEDIHSDMKFGNGVTVGAVQLKTGLWVDCGFMVLDISYLAGAQGRLTAIKQIFERGN